MKRIFYYTTTAIIISCGITQAQTCVPTPTCSTLGYTSSTACDGGLKCPFGEAWNCDLANKVAEIETKVDTLSPPKEQCQIGSILYSDKSCSTNFIDGKTPIGVVVYLDSKGGGQAISLEFVEGSFTWGDNKTDISDLPNYTSEAAAEQDFSSCENSAKIRAAGDNRSTYPAVWAAYDYRQIGTQSGDWCLPAAGIWASIFNNEEAIEAGLKRVGGEKLNSPNAWSSSENNSYSAWYSQSSSKGKNYTYAVRPVLEF